VRAVRPDLPLILIVAAVGVAMALFVEGSDPPAPAGRDAIAGQPDAVRDFLGTLDPALIECLGAVEPVDGGGLDPTGTEGVREVSRRVERLRELRFERPVAVRFLTAERLRERLLALLERELPRRRVEREGELLAELGALPAGSDLGEITREALGSQVVGLYDPISERLLAQTAGDAGADEEIVLAHELEHALADQALGIPERVGGSAEADRELAFAAVVEGDATLLMERYALAHVDLADQLSLGGSVPGEDVFEALPDYVQRNLLFPYLDGLRLVCHRWATGGWRAVDRLYQRPPPSTDQVLFPGRYGESAPAPIGSPARAGPGWASRARRELGAAELEWLFHAPGGDPQAALPDPRRLVFGWAAGEVRLWARGSDRALAIALAERRGSRTLCAALAAWYGAGWPEAAVAPGAAPIELTFEQPGRSAALACEGRETRLGIAPELETALALAG